MSKTCEWKLAEINFMNREGEYETQCYNLFTFDEGTVKDNRFKYCPFCGGKIKVKGAE